VKDGTDTHDINNKNATEKWHVIYQAAPVSTTLRNLKGHFSYLEAL